MIHRKKNNRCINLGGLNIEIGNLHKINTDNIIAIEILDIDIKNRKIKFKYTNSIYEIVRTFEEIKKIIRSRIKPIRKKNNLIKPKKLKKSNKERGEEFEKIIIENHHKDIEKILLGNGHELENFLNTEESSDLRKDSK